MANTKQKSSFKREAIKRSKNTPKIIHEYQGGKLVKETKVGFKKPVNDPVNNPSHYTDSKFEVIDILQDKMTEDEFRGFLKGNVLKYVMRADKKEKPKEDFRKASWYLNKLIENTKETL